MEQDDIKTDDKHTDTHKTMPKGKAISYDTCARVNAFINPRWSNAKLFIRTRDTGGLARIESVQPSTKQGYILIKCYSIEKGGLMLEVGGGVSLDLRLQ